MSRSARALAIGTLHRLGECSTAAVAGDRGWDRGRAVEVLEELVELGLVEVEHRVSGALWRLGRKFWGRKR